jgi:hypothetical protein
MEPVFLWRSQSNLEFSNKAGRGPLAWICTNTPSSTVSNKLRLPVASNCTLSWKALLACSLERGSSTVVPADVRSAGSERSHPPTPAPSPPWSGPECPGPECPAVPKANYKGCFHDRTKGHGCDLPCRPPGASGGCTAWSKEQPAGRCCG